MTSFSTYGAGHLTLVDGNLSPDEETADEQIYAISHAIAAGGARAFLDTARDEADPDAQVEATQWHSANEGWELAAIQPAEAETWVSVCERFVKEMATPVIDMAARIAWDPRWSNQPWHGDHGMGFYRVGMLLAYCLHGDGIGFDDYSRPVLIDGKVSSARDSDVDQLNAWATALTSSREYWYEDTWIDSTESPCLLHLRG